MACAPPLPRINTSAVPWKRKTPDPATREVVVAQAPPEVRVETQTVAPGADYIWQRGYWRWTGVEYAWIPGHWVVRPRPAAVWVEGHWMRRGGGWVWIAGHWR